MSYEAEQTPDKAEHFPVRGVYQGMLAPEQSPLFRLFHIMAIVAVVVVVVHLPVLTCDALCFDDHQYVIENALVRDFGFGSARRFFTEIFEPSTVAGYYQPLTMVSLMVDYALAGKSGTLYPFHRTALVLHVANTLLLIVLLYLLFRNPWAAAISGLLFGIHPVTAETVAWISERKTLLASFFSLWSLICYVLHAQKGKRAFYAGSMILYVLALLCKPIAVMLPILMILLDVWPLRRFTGFRRMIVNKAPLFAIGTLSALVTYLSQSRAAGVRLPGEHGVWHALLILCHNLIFYLQPIVWPTYLSPFYPYPEPFTLLHPKVLSGVVGTFVLAILLVVSLRRSHAVASGLLMFFFAILPTMQIVGFSDEIAANRFLYLPSWGLVILLASLFSWLLRRIKDDKMAFSRWALAAILLTLGVAEAHLLRSYLGYWHDTQTLYERMLVVSPYAYKVHNNLGIVLLGQRNVPEAIKHFKLATKFAGNPVRGAAAYANLGQLLVHTGDTHLGLASLRKVVYACPSRSGVSLHLAWILATHPDLSVVAPEEAVALAERVIQTTGNRVVVLDTLAAAYAANGQLEQAIETARKALNLCMERNMASQAEKIQERLALYHNRQRYCEDPTVVAWAKATQ